MYKAQAKGTKKSRPQEKNNTHHLNLTQKNVDSGNPILATSVKRYTTPGEIRDRE